MDALHTETEEGEIVKKFINRYQKLFWVILLAVVVIVGVTRYWQQHSWQRAGRASEVYQEMLVAEYNRDSNTVNAKGQFLLEEYPRTPYAQMASLLLAKTLVNDEELDKAAEKLRWVIGQASAKSLTSNLATLRLAAILQAQDKFTEALELLSIDVDGAFASLYSEAKGDIYFAKNDLPQAKDAYLKAMYSLPQGMQAPLLQMKLVDLGAANNA